MHYTACAAHKVCMCLSPKQTNTNASSHIHTQIWTMHTRAYVYTKHNACVHSIYYYKVEKQPKSDGTDGRVWEQEYHCISITHVSQVAPGN